MATRRGKVFRAGERVDDRSVTSESSALRSAIDNVRRTLRAMEDRVNVPQEWTERLTNALSWLEELQEQVGRGVHANPALVTMLSNPGEQRVRPRRSPDMVISEDVQLIAYRHAVDGEFYHHTFGNQGEAVILRGHLVDLASLPKRTDVMMVAQGRDIVLHHPDATISLSEVFD